MAETANGNSDNKLKDDATDTNTENENAPNGNATSESGSNDSTPNELEAKIIRQIEYYFSDYNLLRDKFLQEQIKLDDGWVSFDVLIKFNRLKALTTNYKIIMDALKKSSANLVELKEEDSKIRRCVEKPIPELTKEYQQEIHSRSVHVKSFPLDYGIEQLLEFFKTVGTVDNIILRKNAGKFKGSVFATFRSKEEAEEFVKKDEVKVGDSELIRELRPDYHKRKNEKYAAIKEERMQNKLKNLKKDAGDDEDDDYEIIKNSVIKLTGISTDTSREEIKEVCSNYGKVAWIDSKLGDSEAFVRFNAEGAGKEAFDKIKEENDSVMIRIKDTEVTVELTEGEDEKLYFKRMKADKLQMRQKHPAGRRGKRRGGYQGNRGRGGFRRSSRLSGSKRSADGDGDEPAVKQLKVEPAAE